MLNEYLFPMDIHPLVVLNLCSRPTGTLEQYIQLREFIKDETLLQRLAVPNLSADSTFRLSTLLERNYNDGALYRMADDFGGNLAPPFRLAWDAIPTSSSSSRLAVALWYRVNLARGLQYLLTTNNAPLSLIQKIQDFIDNHTLVISTMDIDMYQSQKTFYDNDRGKIKVETVSYQTRPTPLEVLRKKWPTQSWTVEEVIDNGINPELLHWNPLGITRDNANSHTVYLACIFLMEKLQRFHINMESPPEELYFYWVAFVDLFYWGLSQQQQQQPRDMSDERLLNQPINPNDVLTPFEVFYPHDTRAFTAYDLPNVSTILSFIPLQGEQRAPSTPLVKFVQKCMPFCCQRRGLVAHTVDFIKSTPAFFDLFGPVIWCMLANTYPTELAGTDRNTLFDMDRLMRVKHITDSRQSLVYALGRLHLMPSAKSLQKAFHRENDRGCWIVLSAVRLWVNMMIRKDEHYLSVARQCMEWDAITKESIAYAMKIRTTDLYKVLNDPFKPARTVLSDGKKNQKQFVNRYRVTTAISTISKCLCRGVQWGV